jgi:hypothetical protein
MIVSRHEKKSFGVVSVTEPTTSSCRADDFLMPGSGRRWNPVRHTDVIGAQRDAYPGLARAVTRQFQAQCHSATGGSCRLLRVVSPRL